LSLEGGCRAAISLGPKGLFDSAIAFSDGVRCVVFDGLRAAVLKHNIAADFSPVTTKAVTTSGGGESITVKHDLSLAGEDFELTADIRAEKAGFTEQGEPVKAFLNEGRDARSYRWRPDHIMAFVQRNLKLIKPNLKPTHYFIDVFTAIDCFDYYDSSGNFHSMLETRKHWGEAFAWVRDYLGGDAPQTSEAGHDQLTGYIEGADCQHMTLSARQGWPHIRVSSKDWQRVPWFDAVLHDKFSLHGVGYPSRYKLEQPTTTRILESDDYISAEILEGHAMMIDSRGFGRGAVRKYWLAQDFIRSIATDTIETVEFSDGNIHRQIITWKSDAKVYVNRGQEDWAVAGKLLPEYGYFAKNGSIESSIERIDGIIVEQSNGPSGVYVNSRTFNPDGTLPIRPSAEALEYLGDRQFKMIVDWDVQRPAPKDLQIFSHFTTDKAPSRAKLPTVWPTGSYFHCPFDGKGRTYDNSAIYAQTKP